MEILKGKIRILLQERWFIESTISILILAIICICIHFTFKAFGFIELPIGMLIYGPIGISYLVLIIKTSNSSLATKLFYLSLYIVIIGGVFFLGYTFIKAPSNLLNRLFS
jgi:hypothetical protein